MKRYKAAGLLLWVLLIASGCSLPGQSQDGGRQGQIPEEEQGDVQKNGQVNSAKDTETDKNTEEAKDMDVFAALFPDREDGSLVSGKEFRKLADALAANVPGRLTEITYTYRGQRISMEVLAGNREVREPFGKQEEQPEGHTESEPLEAVSGQSEYYDYLLYLPQGYDPEDTVTKWPVIYFFHGIGEKGDDLSKLTAYGIPKYIVNGGRPEAIVIAPQCPEDSHWADTDVEEGKLKLFIEENMEKYRIDPDRVYATGLSMGGRCTWKQALAMPDTFAAIAVVCGRTNSYDFSGILDLPVWMFHGAQDDTVAFSNVNRIVEEAYSQGYEYFKVTVYPYLSHDTWTTVYAREDLYDWLLSQNRAGRSK